MLDRMDVTWGHGPKDNSGIMELWPDSKLPILEYGMSALDRKGNATVFRAEGPAVGGLPTLRPIREVARTLHDFQIQSARLRYPCIEAEGGIFFDPGDALRDESLPR